MAFEEGTWVKVIAKCTHQYKIGYISRAKTFDYLVGKDKYEVTLTSESRGNPVPKKSYVTSGGRKYYQEAPTFYDSEIEEVPDAKVKKQDLIDFALDIKSELLFKELIAEG